MINRSRLFVSASLLLLAGCASVATQPPAQVAIPDTIPQNMTPHQIETPQVEIPQQSGADIIVKPASSPEPVVSANPAVIALLERSRHDTEAGKREVAGASLERALRIEPRNPWLWYELAQLRLAQGQYAQGISLARKSNSFAGQERRLQALNWRVIGNAHVAQGNPPEAEQAFSLAAELEQAAVPEQVAVPKQAEKPEQTAVPEQTAKPEQ